MCGDGKEAYRPPKPKTNIICPMCGRKQTVDTDCWLFQSTQGHGYTCGSGKCPSHTYMILDIPPKSPNELYAKCVELRKEIDEMKAKEQDRMKTAVEKIKASNGTEFKYDHVR